MHNAYTYTCAKRSKLSCDCEWIIIHVCVLRVKSQTVCRTTRRMLIDSSTVYAWRGLCDLHAGIMCVFDMQRCIQHAALRSFTWSGEAVPFANARSCELRTAQTQFARRYTKIFPCILTYCMRDRQSLTHGEQKIRGIILMQCVKSRDVQYAQCSKVCMHIYMRQTQQTFMRPCMNNHPCLRAVRQKSNCLPYNTQNVDWFLHNKCIKRSVWFVRTYNACKSSLKTFAREGVYERHQKKIGVSIDGSIRSDRSQWIAG